jgi:hypothetical protein
MDLQVLYKPEALQLEKDTSGFKVEGVCKYLYYIGITKLKENRIIGQSHPQGLIMYVVIRHT